MEHRESKWKAAAGAVDNAHTALEAGIPILFGTFLFLVFLVGIPTWLVVELLKHDRWVLGAAVAFVEIGTIWVVARDIRRRRAGVLTWLVGIGWVAAIIYVAYGLYFE